MRSPRRELGEVQRPHPGAWAYEIKKGAQSGKLRRSDQRQKEKKTVEATLERGQRRGGHRNDHRIWQNRGHQAT